MQVDLKLRRAIRSPENTIRRMLIQTGDSSQFGYVLAKDGIMSVSLPGRKPVRLPLQLPPLISSHGNTIIQYGDQVLLDEPRQKDIFWISEDGEIRNSVTGKYKGDAWIGMSPDGFSAIGGSVLDVKSQESFSYYTPEGELVCESRLPGGRRVSQVYPASMGKGVVVISTDDEKWLEDHRIHIYDPSGKLRAGVEDIGIVQRLVLLNDDSRLFFQGIDSHGVVDMSSGRILWKNPGKVTLASPWGAVLSPDGSTLFVVVLIIEGRKTGLYTWNLKAFDSTTGREKLSCLLPDKYPASWEGIYKSVSNDRVVLSIGDIDMTISMKNREGGER